MLDLGRCGSAARRPVGGTSLRRARLSRIYAPAPTPGRAASPCSRPVAATTPGAARHRVEELVERDRAAGADVEGVEARRARLLQPPHRREEMGDDVRHVDEVAALRAIAVDGHRLVARETVREEGHHARIGRGRVLPRAVDVEEAQGRRARRAIPRRGRGDALARELVRAIAGDRPGLTLLAHDAGRVAIDGRRGRQHDRQRRAPGPARGQERVARAAQVDGAGALRLREAARHGGDRREVEDAVAAPRRGRHLRLVRDVAHAQLRPGIEPGPPPRRQVVEHVDLVAARQQRAHEVPADETATTGDEIAPHPTSAAGSVATGLGPPRDCRPIKRRG